MSGNPEVLRIGTRGSALARWQADMVAAAIGALPGAPAIEQVIIKTEGDVITDVPLSQVAGKAFFTKEIESALIAADVDLAVHSLKDLATEMPAGLAIGAVMEREDPRDVLISRDRLTFGDLPPSSRVGTSSLRRRSLLARWRRDIELVDLRGNVPTRIEKLRRGEFDAIVLAAAGVIRLGLETEISEFLPTGHVLPAVSQGAVAVQIRAGDEAVRSWVGRLDHPDTHRATDAERALLRRLEGGCQVPVGALASVTGDQLSLRAVVCSLDGEQAVEGEIEGSAGRAEELGLALAERLLEDGAGEILTVIRGGSGGEA
jgi:hydroxymethylbilane synthase